MIEVRDVSKKYDSYPALEALSMNVPKGSIYGLIGVNGAGKTTIIKLLAGILKADSGQVRIDGQEVYDNPAVKARIGLIPDELYFPNGYSLADMSHFYSNIYEIWDDERFHEMIHSFHLDEKARIRSFSKGMKKQAAFCLVMSARPDYLILDEPIDGLDPIVRKQVWRYIVDDVADREMTVLVSSHNLKEMEGICDQIGILSGGRMKMERELDSLKGDLYKVQIAFGASRPDDPYQGLHVMRKESTGSVDLLLLADRREVIENRLRPQNPVVFDVLPLTLEEVFIYELGGEDDEINSLFF